MNMKTVLMLMVAGSVSPMFAGVVPLNTNRQDVVAFFSENVYGVRPDLSSFGKTCEVVDRGRLEASRASRRDVVLNVMTPLGEKTFTAVAIEPDHADGRRVPCIVYLSFESPNDMLECPEDEKLKPWRWPVKDIVRRGYATAAFKYTDVFPDDPDTVGDWGLAKDRPANGWGALSAWALAASRVMDWIETSEGLDASKVAVVGHSRLGKAALWAGVTDTRFACTVVNNSGCLGARVSAFNIADPEPVDYSVRSVNCGETIAFITRTFPSWFAPNCRAKFACKDAALPFDQHWLVAALAPRLVVVGSAEDDHWACPSGEHAGLDLARPAWGSQQDRCRYHLRPGGHDLKTSDWSDYMDFLHVHGW